MRKESEREGESAKEKSNNPCCVFSVEQDEKELELFSVWLFRMCLVCVLRMMDGMLGDVQLVQLNSNDFIS